jgi:hypothetical protein
MKNSKNITPIMLIGIDEYSDSSDFSYPLVEDTYPVASDDPSTKRPNEEELDVPGSELDDEDELIGSEDEENNYYSIGGDNHNNLEEFEEEEE